MLPASDAPLVWSAETAKDIPRKRKWRFRRSQITGLRTQDPTAGEESARQALAKHFLAEVFGPGDPEVNPYLESSGGAPWGFAEVYWRSPDASDSKRLITEVSYSRGSGDSGSYGSPALEVSALWRSDRQPTDNGRPKVFERSTRIHAALPVTRNSVQTYLGELLLDALRAEATSPDGLLKHSASRSGKTSAMKKEQSILQRLRIRSRRSLSGETFALKEQSILQRLHIRSRRSLLHALQPRFAAMDRNDQKLQAAGLGEVPYRAAIFKPIAKRGPAAAGAREAHFPVAASPGVRGGVIPVRLSWVDNEQQHELVVDGPVARYTVQRSPSGR